jgi:hypothetical protein
VVLYEKIMVGKKTTYREYDPPLPSMEFIETDQMITLLTTLTISMLMSIEQQLTSHSRIAREIRNVEAAVVKLAKLNAAPLDDDLVNVGIAAWNDTIHSMQAGLSGKCSLSH